MDSSPACVPHIGSMAFKYLTSEDELLLPFQALYNVEVMLIEFVKRRAHGMTGNLWDGKTLAEWLRRNWAVKLSVRQCQRLFRQLGFRQRKPRPLIAHADPLLQQAHKKTSKAGRSAGGRPLGSR